MKTKLKERSFGGIVGALLATAVGVIVCLFDRFPVCSTLINLSYDLPFLLKSPIQPEEIILVYMDDDSHLDLKQPFNDSWDRGIHARLLERLTEEKAKAVVYDLIFSDRNSHFPEGDERFAKAIRANGRVILAADYLPTADGRTRVTRAIDSFFDRAAGWGIVQVYQDQDFMARRHLHVPPKRDDDVYSSLSWETAKLVGAEVAQDPANRFVDRWINYYGPSRTIPATSFRLAIETNDYCPAGFFSNKVVFIGAYLRTLSSGQRKDELRSPYTQRNEFIPTVDVQATQFLNLVRQDWLKRVPAGIELCGVILAGLALGFGLARQQPWLAAGTATLAALGIGLFAQYLFLQHRFWFSWTVIVLTQIPVALVSSVVYNAWRLTLQKRLLEHSLALYLSPKLVRKFASNSELLRPGAKKETLTILFSDIAGFTSISEGMDSDELARHMNIYFQTAVAECIHHTDGTIVKYIGDAIFAFWNAPDPQSDHALRACEAALRFRDQPPQYMNGQQLVTRIGLHTGVANVGNFGSTARVDYTALGENINLASRMEGLNKYLGTDILITGQTHEAAGEKITARFAGHFRLKGFEKAVEVYELIGFRDEAEATRPWRETFAKALKEFQQRNFDAAERGFRCTLEIRPKDGPAKFYLQQIAEFRVHPPDADWTGEIELKDK